MINSVNSLNNLDYTKYNSMFPQEKLPHYENITIKPFDNTHDIIANNDRNKAELQEMAKQLSESNTTETKVKILSTAAKAEETQKDDEEHNTSDKSTPTNIGSTLAKEGLYRYTGCKLLKPNPYLVAMTLLGVDFEEDGDALKKGAETGKIGDFGGDYKNFFDGMVDRASESDWNAIKEGFNLPANVISIGLQDSLQTIGVGLSQVIGKKTTEFLGSGVSMVGTAFNAIGDVAGDTVKGTVGVFKNLFTGDFDGVGDSATDIYNGVKDSVVDVANSVADVATDGADVVVDAAENVYDVAKDGAGYVADGAEEVYDAAKDGAGYVADGAEEVYDAAKDGAGYVADAAEEVGDAVGDAASAVGGAVSDAADAVGDAVGDAADAVGGAVSDAADAVGDFFDSIF